MVSLGTLLGNDQLQFREWLASQIDSHKPYLEMILHPELPAQVAMLLLRLSVIPQLGYLSRVIPPSLFYPHAMQFDNMVLDTIQRKFGIPNPLSDVAKFTLSLPIKAGGFGLYKVANVSVPAYFSAVAAASEDILEFIPLDQRQKLLLDEKSSAPFAGEVADCLGFLIKAGVVHGLDGPIPDSIQDFWRPGGGVVSLPRRQHEICSQISVREFLTWELTASLKDRQRLVSASAKNASLWLTAFPVAPELLMADELYLLAVKHRLGLCPVDDLPAKCSCGAVC